MCKYNLILKSIKTLSLCLLQFNDNILATLPINLKITLIFSSFPSAHKNTSNIMTSPTSKSTDAKAQTPSKQQQQAAVAGGYTTTPLPSSGAEEGTSMLPPPETPQFRSCSLFSWMKVFRYADLMLRQGC